MPTVLGMAMIIMLEVMLVATVEATVVMMQMTSGLV